MRMVGGGRLERRGLGEEGYWHGRRIREESVVIC